MENYVFPGFCPICQDKRSFTADSEWFRDKLRCPSCESIVRERAVALVLEELLPNWRDLAIHESSPIPRGISLKMSQEAHNYIASQFFSDVTRGELRNAIRSEDLERQTFQDESFDCVITIDVMEHVFNPDEVYKEIWRTLRPNGYYIHAFPIAKGQEAPFVVRASIGTDGKIIHHAAPVYHGNPIDTSGSLVTFDYGYDISKQIARWAPFDVRVMRFCDQTHGILGEYTEVVVCRKRTD